ncbi:hypothetical protein NUU61_005114 [Penicillium alfredii]|uniref:Uncharacterized protein n=1 Tax=Penicillium alfredii TaxID=1506179 RepID=A0A9W9K792_9EURO|nr:uncharacterized protein NUU61_005114 [Penicillium alfredii]KAJ5095758.1 hypothetical protein NUU61_005114 [Penicillium alfredii]
MRQLHGPSSELDVEFHLDAGTMTLKQALHNSPSCPGPRSTAAMHFNSNNSTFVNLQGLADNSLLLTIELHQKTSTAAMQPRPTTGEEQGDKAADLGPCYQICGFHLDLVPDCALVSALALDHRPKQSIQLLLPQNRVSDWKTVAIILLTFRQINTTTWYRMMSSGQLSKVAGFDWAQVQTKAKQSSEGMVEISGRQEAR